MANLDAPFGVLPYLPKDNKDVVKNPYTMSSTASAVKRGDAVMIKSDGLIDLYDGSNPDLVRGVASHNATASQILYVYDDLANQLFYAQTDDTTGILTAQTGINLNANLLRTSSGSSLHSLWEIDESTGLASSTGELKILGLFPNSKNSFGQFNQLFFKFNRHVDAPSTAGV